MKRNFKLQLTCLCIAGMGCAAIAQDKDTIVNLNKELDTVVVSTGYQHIPRERATGSFTVIDNKLLNRAVSTDVISRLDGITNGLFFDKRLGGDPSLIIRGRSTIFADNQPLIVVDNFPYAGDISNINPNDVESITVLKDAAAASIWGVKAANGVIVITTRKGRLNQPLQISLNMNASFTAKPDFSRLRYMQSSDFIDAEEYLFQQGFYKGLENGFNHPPLTPAVELLIQERDGQISKNEAEAKINAFRLHDVRDDFKDRLYGTGINTQYSVTASGGTGNTIYSVQAGWDDNKDNLDAVYRRLSLHAVLDLQLTKWLRWQNDVRYTNSLSESGKPAYGQITSGYNNALYPYAQLADNNGNALPIVRDYRQTFKQQAETQGLLNWDYYPLEDYRYNHGKTSLQDIVLNEGLQFKINNAISAAANLQYENAPSETTALADKQAYSTRDYINRFTQVNSDGSLSYPVPVGGILQTSHTALKSYAARAQVNYNGMIGAGRLDALAGFELRQQEANSYTGMSYGYDANNLTYIPVNYVEYFPTYTNGFTEKITEGKSFSSIVNRYTSQFANAAYTWRNRYTLTGSARRDGSNLFGVNTNKKFVPLWSTGAGWLLSNGQFYHSRIFPYLRLRLSYGYNGNVHSGLSAYTTIRYFSYNTYIPVPYAAIQDLPNPDLQWEKTGTLNAGVDFKAGKDIIEGSLEIYHKHAQNLVAFAPVDPTVGVPEGRLLVNAADMTDDGIELQLTSHNLRGRVSWNTTFILNYNRNRVTSYDTSHAYAGSYITSGISIVPVNGKPLYNVFSYAWAGLDSAGNPQGYLHGKLSENYAGIVYGTKVPELVYSGPALPPVYGSLRNDISYKNFTFSFNIVYRFGYYLRKSSINYNQLFYAWNGNSDYAKRWQRPGDENHTDVPSMIYPADPLRDNFYNLSEATVIKGDNIRLQDIRIDYSFDKLKFKKLPFNTLQVFLYAQNIGILWKANKEGIDPDYPGGMPPPLAVSAGLNIRF